MSYDRRRLRGHHPAACTCVDCKEGRRPLSPRPAPSHPTNCPCSECREGRARKQREQDQQVWQAQQALVTPPPPTKPPTKPPVNRRNVAPPNQFHSYTCTCKVCGDAREQQHREAGVVAPLSSIPPSRRQRAGQRGTPLSTLLKFAMPLVFVAFLVAGVVWWTSNSSSSSESGGTTQVTESSGSWFSADCDNERRRRRRGGWLRALIC